MLRNYLSIHVAEDLTPLLRLGNFSWIVTRDFHKKSKLSTMIAAHQAEVRGPPVGRGPQVENRCSRGSLFQTVSQALPQISLRLYAQTSLGSNICPYPLCAAASIWFEIWGSWIRVKKN